MNTGNFLSDHPELKEVWTAVEEIVKKYKNPEQPFRVTLEILKYQRQLAMDNNCYTGDKEELINRITKMYQLD